MPKVAELLAAMVPFQLTFAALTRFPEPLNVAFQPPVRCGFSLNVRVTFQLFTVVAPPFFTVTLSWYPLPQLFPMVTVQLRPPVLLDELEEELDEEATELVLLDDERTLELLELLLEDWELTELLDAPTTPKGDGCAAQVLRAIQLLLFS